MQRVYLQTIRNLIAHVVFAIITSGIIRHNASRYYFTKLEVSFGLVPNAQELWESQTSVIYEVIMWI